MQEETVLRSRSRKAGKVAPINDLLAYERIVHLPADLAALYSAVQNFRLDLAKGYHRSMAEWETVQASYFQELREMLANDGCNYYPGENGEPWIHVKQSGFVKLPSDRALHLKEIFDGIFCRNDDSLLDSEYFPTPLNCVTTKQIQEFYERFTLRFCVH